MGLGSTDPELGGVQLLGTSEEKADVIGPRPTWHSPGPKWRHLGLESHFLSMIIAMTSDSNPGFPPQARALAGAPHWLLLIITPTLRPRGDTAQPHWDWKKIRRFPETRWTP